MKKWFPVLRWIGFLPCAVLVTILVHWAMQYGNYFSSDPNSWERKYAVPIMTYFLSGFLFIITAVEGAPSFKNGVAIISLSILLLLCGAALFLGYMRNANTSLIINTSSVIGAIAGFAKSQELIKHNKSFLNSE